MRSVTMLVGMAMILNSGLVAGAGAAEPVPPIAPPTLALPESLTAQGIPPLPQSLAEELGRYTEFRFAGNMGWHPKQRELLVGTRFADTQQIHRVRMPLGARTQLTFFPDPVRGAQWEPRRGDYFVFSRDRGGDEFTQLYRFDASSGAVTLLTDGGRSQNSLGRWSRAGDLLAYASTRRNGQDRDLYVMDPAHPETDRRVAELPGGGWGVLDWAPDGKAVLAVEELSVNESHLWLVDVASGARRRVTPAPQPGAEPVAWSGGRFSPDGRAIFTATDREGEFLRLVRLDLASGKTTVLTADIPWDVEDFDLARDGRTLALVTNEDGFSVLRLLDPASGRLRTVAGLPRGLVAGLDFHLNSRELAFTVSSARATYDVYTLDVRSGAVARWTESEIGGLNAERFPEPELIHWPSFDGRAISGLLYRPLSPPPAGGRWPVMINVHGGPEGQSRPGFNGRLNYYLNELGIALVFPNVRGSIGYGKTFVKLDNGRLREDSVKDIGALLDWIGQRADLDPGRVAVVGGSYGGYMTLASAVHYGDRLRCAVDVVGISNFVTFLEHTEAYRRDLRRVEYGDERDPQMREFLQQISPLTHAERIKRPLLVVQGHNDPRVPYTESEQLVARVRGTGTPVWYLEAADEGHGFAKKRNADYQSYAMVEFLRRYLLGEPPG